MNTSFVLFACALLCIACNTENSFKDKENNEGYRATDATVTESAPASTFNNVSNGSATTLGSNEKNGFGFKDEGADKKSTVNSGLTTNFTEQVKVRSMQLIQTADIKFQVEDLGKSNELIEGLILKHGAYISSSNMETSYNNTENRISVRVAPAKFNALINDLMKQSIYTNYKNIRSEDVTAEYVDIETRLRTKREVEARYIDILKNKAKTVDDVLNAENAIRVIHEEIEAKTGRLNYLKDQVALSTINLEFYQVTKITGQPQRIEYSYWSEAGDAFKTGWTGMKRFLIGLIYIWPLYILGFIGYWIIRRFAMKRK
ncbi:MAG: DUF4349 domain-containing protein [Bacteroidia bacterium]